MATTKLISSYESDLETLNMMVEQAKTLRSSQSSSPQLTIGLDSLVRLAEKLKLLTILVKFALSRLLSEPAGLIVAQMVTRGFQLFDEGKRFSKKDPLNRSVRAKYDHKLGYDGDSLDEFSAKSGKRHKSLHPDAVRRDKFIRRTNSHMTNMYNILYETFRKYSPFSNVQVEKHPFPPFVSENLPTLPSWFTDVSCWEKLFENCPWNSKASQEKVKYLVTPSTNQLQQTSRTQNKSNNSSPVKKKKRLVISESDDEENNPLSEDRSIPVANLIKLASHSKEYKSMSEANLVERAGHDSSMALHELQKKEGHKTSSLRSNVAILKIKKRAQDVGIVYDDWMCGTGCCHLRALHVISPDAANEARSMNLKYSDVEGITALADKFKNENKHIFRLFDGTHWVALSDRLYVDDNNAFIVKNYPLALQKLSIMNGVSYDGLSYDFSALADQPSLIDLTYSMSPSLGDLYHKHGLESLNAVNGLIIEKKDVGSIAWTNSVDITGHDLNAVVQIKPLKVTVSYESLKIHPAVGEKLNGPAFLSFFDVKSPQEMDTAKFVKAVKKRLSQTDMTFDSYDPVSQILRVTVEHFSSHELNLDNLEDITESQDSLLSQHDVSDTSWKVTFGSNTTPPLSQQDLEAVQCHWNDFDKSLAQSNSDRFQAMGDMYDSITSIDPQDNTHNLGFTPVIFKCLTNPLIYWPASAVNTVIAMLSKMVEDADRGEKKCYLFPYVINSNDQVSEAATEKKRKQLQKSGMKGPSVDDVQIYKILKLNHIEPEDWEKASQYDSFSFIVHTSKMTTEGRSAEHYARLVFNKGSPDSWQFELDIHQVYDTWKANPQKEFMNIFLRDVITDTKCKGLVWVPKKTTKEAPKPDPSKILVRYWQKDEDDGILDDGCSCGPHTIFHTRSWLMSCVDVPFMSDDRMLDSPIKLRMAVLFLDLLRHRLEENEILNRPRYKRVSSLGQGSCHLQPSQEKFSMRNLVIDTSHLEDSMLESISERPFCPCKKILCSSDSLVIHVSCAGTYHVPCLLSSWKQQKDFLKCFFCGNQPTQDDPFVLVPPPSSFKSSEDDGWEHPSGSIVLDFVTQLYESSSSDKTLEFLCQVATTNYTFGELFVTNDDEEKPDNPSDPEHNRNDSNDDNLPANTNKLEGSTNNDQEKTENPNESENLPANSNKSDNDDHSDHSGDSPTKDPDVDQSDHSDEPDNPSDPEHNRNDSNDDNLPANTNKLEGSTNNDQEKTENPNESENLPANSNKSDNDDHSDHSDDSPTKPTENHNESDNLDNDGQSTNDSHDSPPKPTQSQSGKRKRKSNIATDPIEKLMVVNNFIHVIVQDHIRPARILSRGKSGNEVLLFKYKNGCLEETPTRIYPSDEDMLRWMRAHVVGSDGMFYMPKQGLKVFAFDATEHKEKEATIKSVDRERGLAFVVFSGQPGQEHFPVNFHEMRSVHFSDRVSGVKELCRTGYCNIQFIAYEKQRVLLHTPKMLYNAQIVEINGFFARLKYDSQRNTEWRSFVLLSPVDKDDLISGQINIRQVRKRSVRFDPCETTQDVPLDATKAFITNEISSYSSVSKFRPKKGVVALNNDIRQLLQKNREAHHQLLTTVTEDRKVTKNNIKDADLVDINVNNKDSYPSFCRGVGLLRKCLLTEKPNISHTLLSSLIDCGPLADFNLSCFAQMSVYIILICKFDKDPHLKEKLRDVFLPDLLDLTPQGFVMLLAHGPTDISDHFLLDSILTGTFRNRFGLICACHQCEDTPTLKSYCCDNSVKYEDGHYGHFMETLTFAVSGKDSSLEIVSNEFTTASIIEKHITERSPIDGTAGLAVQVAEKALRAKNLISKVEIESESHTCVYFSTLMDNICILSDRCFIGTLESSFVANNFCIFYDIDDKTFNIFCLKCKNKVKHIGYKSLRDAFYDVPSVAPLHSISPLVEPTQEFSDITSASVNSPPYALEVKDLKVNFHHITRCSSSSERLDSCLGSDLLILGAVKNEQYHQTKSHQFNWRDVVDMVFRPDESANCSNLLQQLGAHIQNGNNRGLDVIVPENVLQIEDAPSDSSTYLQPKDSFEDHLYQNAQKICRVDTQHNTLKTEIPNVSGMDEVVRNGVNEIMKSEGLLPHEIFPIQGIIKNAPKDSDFFKGYDIIPDVGLNNLHDHQSKAMYIIQSSVPISDCNDEMNVAIASDPQIKLDSQTDQYALIHWIFNADLLENVLAATWKKSRNLLTSLPHCKWIDVTPKVKECLRTARTNSLLRYQPRVFDLCSLQPYQVKVTGQNPQVQRSLLDLTQTQFVMMTLCQQGTYSHGRFWERLQNPIFIHDERNLLVCKSICDQSVAENAVVPDQSVATNAVAGSKRTHAQSAQQQNPNKRQTGSKASCIRVKKSSGYYSYRKSESVDRDGCALSGSNPPVTSENAIFFTTPITFEDWNCKQGNIKNTLECIDHDHSFLHDCDLQSKKEVMRQFRNQGWTVFNLKKNMTFVELGMFVRMKLPMIVSISLRFCNQTVEHVIGIVNSQIVDGAYKNLCTIPFTRSNMDWCAGSEFTVASESYAIYPNKKISKAVAERLSTPVKASSKIVCLYDLKGLPDFLREKNIIENSCEQYSQKIKSLLVEIKQPKGLIK